VASKKAPVTLDDVAALAEVSPKTVSRVVNSEACVRPDTRARVQRAIDRLNYTPNQNARVLAGNRSHTIALFFDAPGGYVSDFQAGASERCRESGYHLIVQDWDRESPTAIRHLIALLRQFRPDGAILLPSGVPAIRTNDYLALRQLTAHLLGLGHRRIAFILGKGGSWAPPGSAFGGLPTRCWFPVCASTQH